MAFSCQLSLTHTTGRKFDLSRVDNDVIEVRSEGRIMDEIIISDDEDETPKVVISVEDGYAPKSLITPDSDIPKEIIVLDDDILTPKEIISLDDDEDERLKSWDGTRKENDPLVFTEWTTGNIISASDNSKLFEIIDDENENDTRCAIVIEGDQDEECETMNTHYPGTSKEDELDDIPEPSLSQGSTITEYEATLNISSGHLVQAMSPVDFLDITDKNSHFSQDTSVSMTESPHCLKSKGQISLCELEKKKLSPNTISTTTKKRLFFDTYGPGMLPKLKRKVDYYLKRVPIKRNKHNCWICTDDLPSTRAGNIIRIHIGFRHKGELLGFTMHIGFVSMMLEGMLTHEAKEGIIEQQWHASHLCGNWTCINPHHICAEPGRTNSTRNGCLPYQDKPCVHIPRCLKKLYMNRDLREINREALLAGKYEFQNTMDADVS